MLDAKAYDTVGHRFGRTKSWDLMRSLEYRPQLVTFRHLRWTRSDVCVCPSPERDIHLREFVLATEYGTDETSFRDPR